MLGILIEHTAGRWPFWLSPRQVIVCSVNDRNVPCAEAVARELMAPAAADISAGRNDRGASAAGPYGLYQPHASATSLFVDVDDSARTVPKKVREAQVAQYNVIAVVGDAEQAAGTVTLRFREKPRALLAALGSGGSGYDDADSNDDADAAEPQTRRAPQTSAPRVVL